MNNKGEAMFAADNKMSSYGYQTVPNMQGTPNFGNMSNGMQQPGNITSQMMPNMMQGGFPPAMDYSAGGSLMPNMAAFAKMQTPMPPPPAPGVGGGKNPGARFKKAPDAPKRFKSAFIIFSAEKHKEIKESLAAQGRAEKTTDIAKLVSEAWREMPPGEREGWEDRARQDKARYEVEKSMYKGPWKIPANKRTPKDPTAPKRPMSAFLAFSNKRRAALKRQHPDATNADLSKMLSISWKEAPHELKQKYMEEEAELRAKYKVEMAKWRKKVAEEKKAERKEREAMAMQTAEARQNEAAAGNAAQQSTAPVQSNYGAMTQPSMGGAGGGFPGGSSGMQFYGMTSGGAGFSSAAANEQQGSAQSTGFPGMNMPSNPFASQQLLGGSVQQQQQLLQMLGQQQQQMYQQQGVQQPNMQGMYQQMPGQVGSQAGIMNAGNSPSMQQAQASMMQQGQHGGGQLMMNQQTMGQLNGNPTEHEV